jgi:uncharacterized protein YgbK (DUF1537 family)
LVVADDLSGAVDTGHQFSRRGYETRVVHGDGSADSSPANDDGVPTEPPAVVVRNTDSRATDPAAAADRVAAVVPERGADCLYKKVDSTLRGNVVAETDAVVEAAGAQLAVVAPAFPGNGRRTAGGFHLVGGDPVADVVNEGSERPPDSSHLPTLFEASAYEVGWLSLDDVGTAERVRESLAELREPAEGPTIAVCDATENAHLNAIAAGTAAADVEAVYVGSAGLARYVRLDTGSRRVLGVVGSTNPQTLEQLSALPASTVVPVVAVFAVDGADAAVAEAADRAEEAFGHESRVVLTAALSQADVAETLEAGSDAGLDEPAVRARVADTLGRAARRVHDREPVTGLFACGGAAATRVLDALDGREIRLTGRAVTTGVPVGRVVGGSANGTPVVTKAGGFGGRETILSCLDALVTHHGS